MRATIFTRGAPRFRLLPVVGISLALAALALPPALPGGPDRALAADAADPALVDLNSASLEAVLALPIPADLAQRIVDYRDYLRYFDNVYDLMEVDGMTTDHLAALRPLVATMPPQSRDASLERLSASYRQAQRYLGQEGSSEGLVDEYLDKMRNPENVNGMDLFDLMSYQNVSPVDATNIIKARERLGRIESARQLRRAEGLRYFSYRNLRDFVVYSDEEIAAENTRSLTGYAQTRYTENPYSDNEDLDASIGFYQGYQPGIVNKVRVEHAEGVTAGFLTSRDFAENDWDETKKGFAGWKDQHWGDFRLKGLYVGNYRVAYGLGLIMDNTDYIHFRKTGFGFNKRLIGVHGDLSRSHEFALTGAAFEGTYGRVNASFFVSSAKKDGILNEDGTINRYVIMRPRLEPWELEDRLYNIGYANAPDLVPTYLRRDAFQEDILGGNVKVMLAPGTFVGLTGYEARYDNGFDPNAATLITETSRLEARDVEITRAYDSIVGDEVFKWRRVMGAEAQAVYENVSLQGEYAFLQDPQNDFLSSDNPDAYIVNAFSQWDNLHVLGIWRDYDVGFDNPYGRAFSNDSRYEMTLLDAPYRLNDELYFWLESETPQPKAERGLYLESRYRISRNLILSQLAFDQWTRKADGADLMRYTLKGEYQPIFNLRFRVRHRYSSRSENNPDDVRIYRNWETRWQMIAMLSNFNRLQFTYVTSNVMFPPRGRLVAPPEAGADENYSIAGSAGLPAHAFEVKYEHHLTPGLKFTLASSVYDGFWWNFEGNEFVLLEGNGFRNWFKVESRVSERLLFQLKVTRDHNLPVSYLDARSYRNIDFAENPDATYVPSDKTFVRLQMDYSF